ncbi:MAG: TIM barrel protein [Verrucomicrobiota bacterium]|nr:TIM barrel protein [Verrucomicrobiota bacterium]
MRLGIGTYALAWNIGVPGHTPVAPLTHLGFLQRAAGLGVACVQYADNLPLESLSTTELDALVAEADKLGIAIEVGSRTFTPERFEHSLAVAVKTRSPILRYVIDGPHFEPSLDEVVALVKSCIPALEKHRIILALENHDRFTAFEFHEMIMRINSEWVGICLDTVNSLGAGDGLDTVMEWLAPHTVNFHVKDYSIRRVSHKMGFVVEGTPAGRGMLPVAAVVGRLSKLGHCQSAIIELWPAPEAALDATLAKENAWLDESVANLRPLFPL